MNRGGENGGERGGGGQHKNHELEIEGVWEGGRK